MFDNLDVVIFPGILIIKLFLTTEPDPEFTDTLFTLSVFELLVGSSISSSSPLPLSSESSLSISAGSSLPLGSRSSLPLSSGSSLSIGSRSSSPTPSKSNSLLLPPPLKLFPGGEDTELFNILLFIVLLFLLLLFLVLLFLLLLFLVLLFE